MQRIALALECINRQLFQLLEIVREAHKAPLLSVVYSGRDAYGFCVLENPYWLGNHEVPRPLVINAETEAEALVNALEAAP